MTPGMSTALARPLLAQEQAQPPPLDAWVLVVTALVVVFVTFLAVGVLYSFYRAVGRGSFMENTVRHWIFGLRPRPGTVSAVLDEFVTRRYEFLTFFGQFILAALVVAVIAILLLADRITAEAGLPVLATILGIIFGKTVLSRRALPERSTEGEAVPEIGNRGQESEPQPPSPAAGAAAAGLAVSEEPAVEAEPVADEQESEEFSGAIPDHPEEEDG